MYSQQYVFHATLLVHNTEKQYSLLKSKNVKLLLLKRLVQVPQWLTNSGLIILHYCSVLVLIVCKLPIISLKNMDPRYKQVCVDSWTNKYLFLSSYLAVSHIFKKNTQFYHDVVLLNYWRHVTELPNTVVKLLQVN